jgi:RNA polymerase sigma-70 factor (ECF subfamily)
MSNNALGRSDRPAHEDSEHGDCELQLLSRVAERDRAAFQDLYLRYHRRLARFLMRFVRRYDLAEEVINDTMWEVWHEAAAFKRKSRVSVWIMGIAYRRAVTTLRLLNPVTSHDDSRIERPELSTDAHQSTRELGAWLEVALERLPLEQRLMFELTYGLGHSCDEVAAIMECPANAVMSRMLHAHRTLRARLAQIAEPRSPR